MPDTPSPSSSSHSPEDFATLAQDVRTIKKILEGEDARLPKVWRFLWSAALAIFFLALAQFSIPALRALSFDKKVLVLWLPLLALVALVNGGLLFRDMKKTGLGFLSRRSLREFVVSRAHLLIAVFVIGYLLSRDPKMPLDGIFLILISLMQTLISLIIPAFRWVPYVFLGLGLLEWAFQWSGPPVTLFNATTLAVALGGAGAYLKATNQPQN